MNKYNVSFQLSGFNILEAESEQKAREIGEELLSASFAELQDFFNVILEKDIQFNQAAVTDAIETWVEHGRAKDFDVHFIISGSKIMEAANEEAARFLLNRMFDDHMETVESRILLTGVQDIEGYATETAKIA